MFTSHLLWSAERLVDATNVRFNGLDVNVAPKNSLWETFNSPVSEDEMLTSVCERSIMGLEGNGARVIVGAGSHVWVYTSNQEKSHHQEQRNRFQPVSCFRKTLPAPHLPDVSLADALRADSRILLFWRGIQTLILNKMTCCCG